MCRSGVGMATLTKVFYPGRRLSYSGARCTVRYIGQVEDTKGEWLGVEWDDDSKGKHDGSHNGVKYFTCRSTSPQAASFLRPSRPSDQPLSFLEALKKKYASGDSIETPVTYSEIRIGGKVAEEIGFEKVKLQLAKLPDLQIVILDNLCVSGVHAQPWLACQELRLQEISRIEGQNLGITHLDLGKNLIERWADVVGICGALPQLTSLKLDGNRFFDLSLPHNDSDHQPFQLVTELSLDETLLSWDEITSLTVQFTILTTLSLSGNNLATISSPLLNPGLKSLTLSSNRFSELQSFLPLCSLPTLENLSLRSNPLTTLITKSPVVFPSLLHLDLTSTCIPSLPSLTPITKEFPRLTSLLTSKTPLSVTNNAFLLTTARISTLTSLNYSRITPPERQNAELYYLSLIGKEISNARSDKAAENLLALHPRYAELCQLYGEPETAKRRSEAGETETREGTLGARIIEFAFYKDENGMVAEKRKEIPRTVSVYRLKGIVGDLFGIRPMGCKLVWETGQWDPVSGEDEGWSCSEDDEDEDEEVMLSAGIERGGEDGQIKENDKWVQREIELVDSTRDVGYWIEGRTARVRVELR